MNRWLFRSIAAAVVLFPDASQACSVCFSALEETRTAFVNTTVFLSVLPPLLVGGFVWWLWRRGRALRQLEESGASHPLSSR